MPPCGEDARTNPQPRPARDPVRFRRQLVHAPCEDAPGFGVSENAATDCREHARLVRRFARQPLRVDRQPRLHAPPRDIVVSKSRARERHGRGCRSSATSVSTSSTERREMARPRRRSAGAAVRDRHSSRTSPGTVHPAGRSPRAAIASQAMTVARSSSATFSCRMSVPGSHRSSSIISSPGSHAAIAPAPRPSKKSQRLRFRMRTPPARRFPGSRPCHRRTAGTT